MTAYIEMKCFSKTFSIMWSTTNQFLNVFLHCSNKAYQILLDYIFFSSLHIMWFSDFKSIPQIISTFNKCICWHFVLFVDTALMKSDFRGHSATWHAKTQNNSEFFCYKYWYKIEGVLEFHKKWGIIQMGTDSESLDHVTRQTFIKLFTDI